MTYYEEYLSGHLILPKALMEHFAQLFPSSDDFLVWLYFYDNRDIAPSEIAHKTGKKLTQVNHSITALQNFGSLKVTLIDLAGEVETIFDVSPVFKHLDQLNGHAEPENQNEEATSPSEDNQLKDLVETFEAEMGVISPMQIDELRALLFEDKYEASLIKLALKEAVLNRKLSFKYIKAILRNWKNEGLTNVQAVENKQSDFQASKNPKQTKTQDFYIPMDGIWN
ncbi:MULTISPECIES: DnaD domain-containing protein [unclassified Lactococcus]|uniref:DnaD domain-containing protein n=1 Tax=unclassified Lactococcus TaxID=2643510 RepID=UPI0011C93F2A|nr:MULTISPECIES: DnaD domain-containing protein [unclassified Lactococcus]MQW23140.1 DnaD domain protein [Lactococcus sp. dk101]TXK44192.1 DnaD domain-containing protein [Lactococcus sp. dk310]TXK49923.1 DnaD domain-containing protein [Lactococcus sp. dk322]